MKKQLKILSVFLLVATLASTSFFIVSANKSVNPVAKSEGDKVVTVLYPKENGRGDGAEVLTPIEKSDSDKCCVTAEEHSIIGGLGSAVAEVLCETVCVPLERVGTKDTFGESGKPDDLMVKYGLTVADIYDAAKKSISRKG